MNNKTLIIKEIARSPHLRPEDKITFLPGVNVIVGPPNTGKTKWFQMLDYLFGQEKKPEEVFGDELAEKYDSVQMIIEIAGEEALIERRWKEPGSLRKVFINGETYPVKDLWYFLMEKLEIPVLHYPQGNPLGSRAWSELGWRSLFRHIYRRQKFWTDFADKQPDSEQHACLVQFMGIAEHLFSEQFQELVSKEKQIMQLQSSKDQFISMLQEVSKEIIDENEIGVALTPQSIESAIKRIEDEMRVIEQNRNEVIVALLDTTAKSETESESNSKKDKIHQLGEQQAELNVRQENILTTIQKTESRLKELKSYRTLIADELARMQRASEAGSILEDLKVTHCPACDREILRRDFLNECYLCLRPVENEEDLVNSANQRIQFELEQLLSEVNETDQLIQHVEQDITRLQKELGNIENSIFRLEQLLKPTRSAVAAILPPELLTTDIETGRLQERLQQLERIKTTLHPREKIADQILEIQKTLADLEAAVNEHNRQIDFERSGDILSDAMNTYLNYIKKTNPRSWTQSEVIFRIDDRRFNVRVGGSSWTTKLGGTLTLYFLIAYHYALMSLVINPQFNYPGFLLLDFPAELEDADSVADKENFVIEPFVALLAKEGMEATQVIAGGSSFENLKGSNRIEFSKIWK
jgi:hypothetical protein